MALEVPETDCFNEEDTLVTVSHLSSDIKGKRVNNLSIRGLTKDTWIHLPSVLTHPCLPNTSEVIARADIIKKFPHLESYVDLFPPFKGAVAEIWVKMLYFFVFFFIGENLSLGSG